jgi:hypothetical protein
MAKNRVTPADFIKALAALPPAPKAMFKDEINYTWCACNKRVPITKLDVKNSGVISYVNNVCAGCPDQKDTHKLATLVCVSCKRVVARMEPMTDKTGFAFKPNSVYHVDGCPICRPGQTATPIIEKLLHDRSRGIQH